MRSPTFLRVALITLAALGSRGVFAARDDPRDPVTSRWYSVTEMDKGRSVYATHCAACHGARAEGQPRWEERDESGYYPAPPLDGTGHSANHPLAQMLKILDTGGGPMGGTMPSFVDVLTPAEKRAVIAWVQSLWPAEAYEAWAVLRDD